ncbi:helix-turn-helix domain-containing protein [Nocardioides sp. Root151]|uniref:helix-turn-helix domain-containing protein n=1 Tax=Nocardioides sp. Root151 TaxID=1736475 RepID=UPI0007038AAA|nr:helix-turn-helix domain-containing protein [Nocardioides sp. Root151]KQZ67124.1 hypothetical protein ASD66_19225 [Nocardioides sp. Root151]
MSTPDLRALAELVIADRPVSDDQLRDAAAGLDDDTTRTLIAARGRLDRLRSRDRELSALMSSIRELVGVRDVQPLLQKLVDRAHELMGTDVTYLSEYDAETDELFVRANRGAVSANMRGLRVPAGVGLASKVVQTRSPQWTDEYDEGAFPRDSEVTAAVQAEHMRSILGVPLISSDRVLGVLFAADRSTHGFSTDQVALLTAFANHGAVILQTARLLEAERTAAAKAATASAEAERRAAAMEASAAFHEELTRLVLAGEGSSAIVESLARALGREVSAADRDLVRVAGTGLDAWWVDDQLRPEIVAAVEESRNTAHWVGLDSPDLPDGVVAAMAGSTLLGALLVGGGDELDDVQRRTIERAAQIHALVTMQRDAMADAEERVRGEFVGDLVSGRADWTALQQRAKQRGVVLDGDWLPVYVDGWDRQRWSLTRSLAAMDTQWLVAQHGTGVLALVRSDEDAQELADRVARRLTGTESPGLVVAGDPVPMREMPAEVDTVTSLAEALPGIGVTKGAVTARAYAPYLVLFGGGAQRASGFITDQLQPLIAWDSTHASALVATLATYLEQHASVTRTAEALFVHPNTVKQRLERIGTLLGDDWRTPERQFRLGIALRLHQLKR